MAKHTPGPWKLGKQFTSGRRSFVILETADGKNVIAHVSIPMPNPNARLIAAAPDAIAACKMALAYLTYATTDNFQLGGDRHVREVLEAAIRKATGEE